MLSYSDHINYRSSELRGQGRRHVLAPAMFDTMVDLAQSCKHCTYP
ncbi:hypothetical protein PPO43_01205 [Saprospira sp. CCB-QB6]|nr:hypothetical protein [Saprospira sp. CCB-QB6]WCL81712.1 hypothetical protein PPO43_01205 [Saprospira sp. CCB-QB6]